MRSAACCQLQQVTSLHFMDQKQKVPIQPNCLKASVAVTVLEQLLVTACLACPKHTIQCTSKSMTWVQKAPSSSLCITTHAAIHMPVVTYDPTPRQDILLQHSCAANNLTIGICFWCHQPTPMEPVQDVLHSTPGHESHGRHHCKQPHRLSSGLDSKMRQHWHLLSGRAQTLFSGAADRCHPQQP